MALIYWQLLKKSLEKLTKPKRFLLIIKKESTFRSSQFFAAFWYMMATKS